MAASTRKDLPTNRFTEGLNAQRSSAPPVYVPLIGTSAQIEWAEVIRVRVNEEFQRVAAAFRAVAERQDARRKQITEAIIAIVEEKRLEVLSHEKAGYFMQEWREISDQVRQMIAQDPRYQALQVFERDK